MRIFFKFDLKQIKTKRKIETHIHRSEGLKRNSLEHYILSKKKKETQ